MPVFNESSNAPQATPKEMSQLFIPYLVFPQPDGTSIVQPIQAFSQVISY